MIPPRSSHKSSWIWGEEHKLYYSTPGVHYVEWHRSFGSVVAFPGAFGHRILSITDLKAINYILGEGTYQFPKPDGVRAWFRMLLGEGVLWVEGKEAHENQRRAIAPALSPQTTRNLMDMFYHNSAKVVTQWHKIFDATTHGQVTVDGMTWAGRFALDTVARAAFSYDFGCLDGRPNILAETLDGLTNHEKSRSSFYMRALFWLVPSILHIGTKGRLIRQTRKELGNLVSDILKDAKVVNDPNNRTLLSHLLRTDKKSGAQQMDEEQIAAQMRTIISAGYETVSATITWILYELAMHPDQQRAIREEVSVAGDPSFDELSGGFPLLDAFFMETLRMHPPVLENHHQAAETISVPLSERLPGTADLHLIVPKGTVLFMPVNVIQQDQAVWGPDADVFRPERWLHRTGRGSRDLFAFSLGPRGCLGRSFAVAEVKALVITLLRQFSLSCPCEIEAFQSFVIRPRVIGEGHSSLPLVIQRISV